MEFSEIKIFKIGAPQIPDSCLPAGMILKNPYNKILPIAPSNQPLNYTKTIFSFILFFSGSALVHHVLSVSSSNDPEQLLTKNLLGFVVV
jgi:hypothetical protein